MRQRILNGFKIEVFGCFLWLNAYGFGVGRVDGWEFVRYRTPSDDSG